MEVSKSFSIEALLAPPVTSATTKPEVDQMPVCGSPEVVGSPQRQDDSTSTYRDREVDSPTAVMSPRSYESTGSSMAGDERPGSRMSETAVASGDDPSSSSPELITSANTTSGLGRHVPGLMQTLHGAHRDMLDVMHARSPAALPPGIIQSSPGHPPFPAFTYNGFHHAAAIAGLPGRAHQAGASAGSRGISPGTLQAALAGSGGTSSAFHAPSSTAVRLGGRPPVTAAVTSAGTTSTSAADNALQRLAAQAAQQHIHSLQLDWLARAGVYMPRLIDYSGTFKIHKKDTFLLPLDGEKKLYRTYLK